MAWTPPIKHLKKKELLNAKRFYRLISQNCNYIDPDMAFLFYIGLVLAIGDELRKHQFVRLPHLGDMALVMQKPRPAWVGKSHVVIGSRAILKFYPKEFLRRKFSKQQAPPRFSEIMPPPPIR